MENTRELNLEELDRVTGGDNRTINTGTDDNAAVRSGPAKSYRQIASLTNGTVVNTVGGLIYDAVSGRNFVQIEFTDRSGNRKTGYVAASLVGLKR